MPVIEHAGGFQLCNLGQIEGLRLLVVGSQQEREKDSTNDDAEDRDLRQFGEP